MAHVRDKSGSTGYVDPIIKGPTASLASATRQLAITPSDTTEYDGIRRLEIGGAGNIALRMNGIDITRSVLAGDYLDLSPQRILATGTTATGIIALF